MNSTLQLGRPSARGLRVAGFSIVETVIALGVGGLALSGSMVINSQQLRMVKSTRDSSAASHSMQERVEQLRIANWVDITDPLYLSDTLFATNPKSVAPLDSYRERITVQAWPDPAVCEPLVVEKTNKAAPRIVLSGTGLADERLAKVDVRIEWVASGRTRVRELTTIISNGGISRMNLPAMGALGDANWTPALGDPVPQPVDTGSGGSGGTTGGTTTVEPVVKGRGTVGGKGGKK